jgi:hypothetical protein
VRRPRVVTEGDAPVASGGPGGVQAGGADAVSKDAGNSGRDDPGGSGGRVSALWHRFPVQLTRWSPAIAAAVVVLLLGAHDVWGIDLNLDQGLDEAGGEVKRYLRKGLQIFGLACCVIGLGYAGFKFSKKDHEAVWYLAGAAVGAAVFVAAGALLG